MNELAAILQTIRRPFLQESRSGCQNSVVVNGLGNYVSLWVTKARKLTLNPAEKESLDTIANLFADYETLSPTQRLDVIQNAAKQIETMLQGTPVTPSTVKELPLSQSTSSVAEPLKSVPSDVHEPRSTAKEAPPATPCPPSDILDAAPPEESPENSSETPTAEVTTEDAPVSTDPASLNFLRTSIQCTKGIGTRRAAKLAAELDIHTVGDLLEYYPRDYLNRSHFRSIYDVGRGDEHETIQGKVVNRTQFTPRRRGAKLVGKFAVYDETGVAVLVSFGRRITYLKHLLKIGTRLVVSGKFTRRSNEIQATDFEVEVLEDEDADLIHTGRIVPKYPLTANITQRMLRQWVKSVLDEHLEAYPEIIPLELRRRHQLMDRRPAIGEIHFPTSETDLEAARRRLVFDEFFLLEVGLELKKRRWETKEKGIAFQVEGDVIQSFFDALPFQLTHAQERVIAEIKADMGTTQAMNRLLQGDVGSGKTIVAVMAMLCAIQSGYQGTIMVPTEILAEQHAYNLSELLRSLNLNVVLLKSDIPKKEREAVLAAIADGSAHIVVGTHALIQDGVEFHQLGLVIIDEQHRFGVMQRATLRDKGNTPDVLVMTATPIPRTLALTVYGDLNVSVIDEMPPGRREIGTKWVKEKDRDQLYARIEKEIQRGRQAYIVYPLVEESEKLEEIKAATEMAAHFQHNVYPHLRVGLLHGRMRSAEKQEVMFHLKNREIDILVSTTVIEVGIDYPNASIMVIENAERFGLAQLHQLRGRVGRGKHKSSCYLIADPKGEDSVSRIKAMTRTNDGFALAEEDLRIRGPGEFFGTRQSGLPDFKIGNIIRDAALLELAKVEAGVLTKSDPTLRRPEHQVLKAMLQTQWKKQLEMVSIG
jgi:ATP-dependent DNA helicase RecG